MSTARRLQDFTTATVRENNIYPDLLPCKLSDVTGRFFTFMLISGARVDTRKWSMSNHSSPNKTEV